MWTETEEGRLDKKANNKWVWFLHTSFNSLENVCDCVRVRKKLATENLDYVPNIMINVRAMWIEWNHIHTVYTLYR